MQSKLVTRECILSEASDDGTSSVEHSVQLGINVALGKVCSADNLWKKLKTPLALQIPR